MFCPRSPVMSDRNPMSRRLRGIALLCTFTLVAACDSETSDSVAVIPPARNVATPAESGQAIAQIQQQANRLESLDELGDQPLARRKLEIQNWQTEGGARVLFVEARELPMFDLRLTFAAGSSQDGGVPGLAMLTN